MLFHRSKPPVTVSNADEEHALGAGWSRTIPQPEPPQASRWEPEPEDEPEREFEPEQPEDAPEEKPDEEEQQANEEAPARPKRAQTPLKRTPPGRRRKA